MMKESFRKILNYFDEDNSYKITLNEKYDSLSWEDTIYLIENIIIKDNKLIDIFNNNHVCDVEKV